MTARLFAEDGSLGFSVRRYAGPEPIRVKGDEDDGMVTLWHPVRPAIDIDWERVGFGIFIGQMSNGADRWSVKGFEIPCWAMAFVSGTATLICWRRARKRRPSPQGLCARCGYDLRASPIRCPECGEAIPPRPQIADDDLLPP